MGVNYHLFHDVEKLQAFLKGERATYLVVDSEIPKEVREDFVANKRFVLMREAETALIADEIGIEKYRDMDTILERIYSEELETVQQMAKRSVADWEAPQAPLAKPAVVAGETHQLIAVYSPVHRIGKTQFAIEMGKELAKKKSVLYLNLEPYAGFGQLDEKQEENLANLLYYASQEYQNLGLKLSMLTGHMGKLDYIEPMEISQDLYHVKLEHWKALIERIQKECIYETIILDVSDGIDGLYGLLDYCDTVYTHFIEEPIALEKIKRYTENLMKTGYASVLEHTIQKKVVLN